MLPEFGRILIMDIFPFLPMVLISLILGGLVKSLELFLRSVRSLRLGFGGFWRLFEGFEHVRPWNDSEPFARIESVHVAVCSLFIKALYYCTNLYCKSQLKP